MKQIHSPIKTAAGICGEQKPDINTAYRYTKHCIRISCEDGTLLYHTLTGELLLLENERSDDEREQLIKRWFLVPENFDECRHADQVRQIARLLRARKTEKTHFTILTTTDCNARCFYCYEMGIRRYPMTPEVAGDVGEYIARVSKGKKVNLSWFGGEPLLNQEVMDIICHVLQEKGVPYTSIITSNGFYLDDSTAKKAVEDWHITSAQITIDGTEEKYNRTKAYVDRSTESPYQRVLHNIGAALAAGMEVTVRLNMDRANADDLFSVVDELAERFGQTPGLHVHVAILRKVVGDIHAFATEDEAADYRNRLNDRLKELGYLLNSEFHPMLCTNQCMADNDSCEVILPDGKIEKCEHLDENEIIGSIYADERDSAIVESWKETVRFPECKDCALYPKCVNLKKCPWMREGCSKNRRLFLMNIAEEQIRNYYLKMKNDAGPLEDEVEIELHAGGSRW